MTAYILFIPDFLLPAEIPEIINYPILTPSRVELTKEYSLRHYGTSGCNLAPKMIVIHCTALDSLKESGDLEYAADVVLFLTEAQERCATPPARAVDLTIGKNRHGDTGKIGLIFRPDLGTLREEARL